MPEIKYYYKGEPLINYCKKNNIHESSILILVLEHFMTVDEAVDHYWEHKGNKQRNNLIYEINGVSVKSLLKDRKLYYKFCNRLYKSKDKNVERIYNEMINAKETN